MSPENIIAGVKFRIWRSRACTLMNLNRSPLLSHGSTPPLSHEVVCSPPQKSIVVEESRTTILERIHGDRVIYMAFQMNSTIACRLVAFSVHGTNISPCFRVHVIIYLPVQCPMANHIKLVATQVLTNLVVIPGLWAQAS